MKKGKAVGPDEVSIEMLDALEEYGLNLVHKVFNEIYETGVFPEDFLASEFITLPKKPGAVECKNHRTISIMCHSVKLILSIIIERLRNKIRPEIAEEQFGFMPDKGTRNAIFVLRMLSERAIEHQNRLYLCFIDYTKAFDKVQHEKLIVMLQDIGFQLHDTMLSKDSGATGLSVSTGARVPSCDRHPHSIGDKVSKWIQFMCFLSSPVMLFSVRLVTADYYLSAPIRGLDVCYSDFRGTQVTKVPVIRIFGTTPRGQKTCLHIHGVFPYILVDYNGQEDDAEKFSRMLAISIDKAINIALGSANSSTQHVFKITVVSGVPFYGYHNKEQIFFRIYFYNPNIIRKALELLQNGAVMNQVFQPHEAHAPFLLQMFIDFNLFGMSMVNLKNVKFRGRPESTITEISSCSASLSNSHSICSNFDTSISSPHSTISNCYWNLKSIPRDSFLDELVEKQSCCELEVDTLACDILNRVEFDEIVSDCMNPGLRAIWDDEKQRRRKNLDSSQITPPSSQDRNPLLDTEIEKCYLQRLKQSLPKEQSLTQSSDSDVTASLNRTLSCQLDEHLSAPEEKKISTQEEEAVALVNEDVIQQTMVSLSQKSYSENINSQELVEMMAGMITDLPTDGEVDEQAKLEAEVEHESLEMSQIIWNSDDEENCKKDNDLEDSVPNVNSKQIPQLDGANDQKFPNHQTDEQNYYYPNNQYRTDLYMPPSDNYSNYSNNYDYQNSWWLPPAQQHQQHQQHQSYYQYSQSHVADYHPPNYNARDSLIKSSSHPPMDYYTCDDNGNANPNISSYGVNINNSVPCNAVQTSSFPSAISPYGSTSSTSTGYNGFSGPSSTHHVGQQQNSNHFMPYSFNGISTSSSPTAQQMNELTINSNQYQYPFESTTKQSYPKKNITNTSASSISSNYIPFSAVKNSASHLNLLKNCKSHHESKFVDSNRQPQKHLQKLVPKNVSSNGSSVSAEMSLNKEQRENDNNIPAVAQCNINNIKISKSGKNHSDLAESIKEILQSSLSTTDQEPSRALATSKPTTSKWSAQKEKDSSRLIRKLKHCRLSLSKRKGSKKKAQSSDDSDDEYLPSLSDIFKTGSCSPRSLRKSIRKLQKTENVTVKENSERHKNPFLAEETQTKLMNSGELLLTKDNATSTISHPIDGVDNISSVNEKIGDSVCNGERNSKKPLSPCIKSKSKKCTHSESNIFSRLFSTTESDTTKVNQIDELTRTIEISGKKVRVLSSVARKHLSKIGKELVVLNKLSFDQETQVNSLHKYERQNLRRTVTPSAKCIENIQMDISDDINFEDDEIFVSNKSPDVLKPTSPLKKYWKVTRSKNGLLSLRVSAKNNFRKDNATQIQQNLNKFQDSSGHNNSDEEISKEQSKVSRHRNGNEMKSKICDIIQKDSFKNDDSLDISEERKLRYFQKTLLKDNINDQHKISLKCRETVNNNKTVPNCRNESGGLPKSPPLPRKFTDLKTYSKINPPPSNISRKKPKISNNSNRSKNKLKNSNKMKDRLKSFKKAVILLERLDLSKLSKIKVQNYKSNNECSVNEKDVNNRYLFKSNWNHTFSDKNVFTFGKNLHCASDRNFNLSSMKLLPEGCYSSSPSICDTSDASLTETKFSCEDEEFSDKKWLSISGNSSESEYEETIKDDNVDVDASKKCEENVDIDDGDYNSDYNFEKEYRSKCKKSNARVLSEEDFDNLRISIRNSESFHSPDEDVVSEVMDYILGKVDILMNGGLVVLENSTDEYVSYYSSGKTVSNSVEIQSNELNGPSLMSPDVFYSAINECSSEEICSSSSSKNIEHGTEEDDKIEIECSFDESLNEEEVKEMSRLLSQQNSSTNENESVSIVQSRREKNNPSPELFSDNDDSFVDANESCDSSEKSPDRLVANDSEYSCISDSPQFVTQKCMDPKVTQISQKNEIKTSSGEIDTSEMKKSLSERAVDVQSSNSRKNVNPQSPTQDQFKKSSLPLNTDVDVVQSRISDSIEEICKEKNREPVKNFISSLKEKLSEMKRLSSERTLDSDKQSSNKPKNFNHPSPTHDQQKHILAPLHTEVNVVQSNKSNSIKDTCSESDSEPSKTFNYENVHIFDDKNIDNDYSKKDQNSSQIISSLSQLGIVSSKLSTDDGGVDKAQVDSENSINNEIVKVIDTGEFIEDRKRIPGSEKNEPEIKELTGICDLSNQAGDICSSNSVKNDDIIESANFTSSKSIESEIVSRKLKNTALAPSFQKEVTSDSVSDEFNCCQSVLDAIVISTEKQLHSAEVSSQECLPEGDVSFNEENDFDVPETCKSKVVHNMSQDSSDEQVKYLEDFLESNEKEMRMTVEHTNVSDAHEEKMELEVDTSTDQPSVLEESCSEIDSTLMESKIHSFYEADSIVLDEKLDDDTILNQNVTENSQTSVSAHEMKINISSLSKNEATTSNKLFNCERQNDETADSNLQTSSNSSRINEHCGTFLPQTENYRMLVAKDKYNQKNSDKILITPCQYPPFSLDLEKLDQINDKISRTHSKDPEVELVKNNSGMNSSQNSVTFVYSEGTTNNKVIKKVKCIQNRSPRTSRWDKSSSGLNISMDSPNFESAISPNTSLNYEQQNPGKEHRKRPSSGDRASMNSRKRDRRSSVSELMTPHSSKMKPIDKEEGDSKLQNELKSPVRRRLCNDSTLEGPTPQNTFNFQISMEEHENHKSNDQCQHLTTMSLEVHAQTRDNLLPDPQFDEVMVIFFYVHTDDSVEFALQSCCCGIIIQSDDLSRNNFGGESSSTKSLNYVKQVSELRQTISKQCGLNTIDVTIVADEKEIFKELIHLIRRYDPEILVGYEIQMSSWGYLIERASHLDINLCSLLSRIPDCTSSSHANDEINRYGADHMSEINIAGRIVLNGWRIFRSHVTLNIYTFENVLFHVLHQRTPVFTHKTLNKWFSKSNSSQKWKVIEYYMTRVEGLMKMLQQIDCIGHTSELARVFGIQFYEVLTRGTQIRVESLMLRSLRSRNFIAVSPSVQQRSQSLAAEFIPLVMEPKTNFYKDPVVVLDFQSLYPSICIAYNYCYSTCLGRVDYLTKSENVKFGCLNLNVTSSMLQELKNDITVSPSGHVFVKNNIRQGILPQLLNEILTTRIMVKQSMKEWKDIKSLYKLLDARQFGLKMIANVTYGYTSANYSGRMPCVDIADSIVSKARQTLENAIKFVQESEKWNAQVIYGDTDSLFVLLPGRTKQEAFQIGNEIAEAVTANNPKPVKLKFEKVYLPCILEAKKRYVGNMYETEDQKEGVYNAKGIETVRRDSCPATSKILEKSLRILFNTKDVLQVKTYVMRQFEKICKDKISFQDYTFCKEYRGRHNYRPGACVPALKLARKFMQKDKRSEPRVGERVPYVIVHGSPGMPLFQLVRSPREFLQDSSLRINLNYYISRVIAPPLNRALSVLGVDTLQWYSEVPRVINVPRYRFNKDNSPVKSAIFQYFVKLNCSICGELTNQGVCNKCSENPQNVAVTLNGKIRKLERSYNEIIKICQSCSRSSYEHQECQNFDCPNKYKLHNKTMELSEADNLRALDLSFAF
ncbi:DNA polymerase zeta catalytic subunit [Nymphon striatum]|nr:DNA polymerase zeta catalytic subunit [Nymphon striatum]